MRCSRAVKDEGKKPKFGECVRAHERGESFTRSVHPRSEKARTFFRFSGEKYARKRIVVFVFPRRLSGFSRAVLSWQWIVGRKSARDTGMALRFGSWDAGATRTVRRGENTARSAVVKRCALSRCSSFVFMLSLDSGANAPVFSFEL